MLNFILSETKEIPVQLNYLREMEDLRDESTRSFDNDKLSHVCSWVSL